MQITNEYITKKNSDFHNSIALSYDSYQEQLHSKVVALYRDLLHGIFASYERKDGPLSILDFGCGTGFLEQFLQPEINSIDGIDVSNKLLNIAKRKFPTVSYSLRDIYTFKSKKKYDIIVGNSVLHHLKDYDAALNHLLTYLKPGGNLFIGAEPNYYSYYYLNYLKHLYRQVLPDNRSLKTTAKIESLEPYAEYHMYFSNGFRPFAMRKKLLISGFTHVKIQFSSREFFGSLIDRMSLRLIDYIPNILMDSTWIFSRLFYTSAFNYKR